MTANEPSNGDIDVPENFSADELQQSAEALESLEPSAAAETTEENFDIDLGIYSSSLQRGRRYQPRLLAVPPAIRKSRMTSSSTALALRLPKSQQSPRLSPRRESDAGHDALEAFRTELAGEAR